MPPHLLLSPKRKGKVETWHEQEDEALFSAQPQENPSSSGLPWGKVTEATPRKFVGPRPNRLLAPKKAKRDQEHSHVHLATPESEPSEGQDPQSQPTLGLKAPRGHLREEPGDRRRNTKTESAGRQDPEVPPCRHWPMSGQNWERDALHHRNEAGHEGWMDFPSPTHASVDCTVQLVTLK